MTTATRLRTLMRWLRTRPTRTAGESLDRFNYRLALWRENRPRRVIR